MEIQIGLLPARAASPPQKSKSKMQKRNAKAKAKSENWIKRSYQKSWSKLFFRHNCNARENITKSKKQTNKQTNTINQWHRGTKTDLRLISAILILNKLSSDIDLE